MAHIPDQTLPGSQAYIIQDYHATGISKHSRMKRERRNQTSALQQVVIGTLIRLASQASTIPTHPTQGRHPLSTK